jgi:hypothetical protein
MCKVQWSDLTKEEATWEGEEELKAKFPSFFLDPSESLGRDSFYGGGGGKVCNTPRFLFFGVC